MAIPATIGFLLLAAGLILARPDRPPMRAVVRDTPGGAMLRRLLPAVVGAPLVLSALRVSAENAGLFGSSIGDWLFVVAIIGLALPLILLVAQWIDHADDHRRRAETLQAGEERTRRIVETAHDAFVSMDPTGRITSWNAAACRIFGWTAE